jgi:RNA polymerase sigma-70 factor (ECF subfamily)
MTDERAELEVSDRGQLPTDDFAALTGAYHHELLVHCYRFLGTLEDGEDALQETLLRAWRHMDTLNSPSALRAWLYKIATHVCLDMLSSRKARFLPSMDSTPADPRSPLPGPVLDPLWLSPLPEMYLAGQSASPAARYELRESVALAFLTVLQKLPPRQRAILILRDVLDWEIREVAELLEMTPTAVNSALQRARATMQKHPVELSQARLAGSTHPDHTSLLERFSRAWETADATGLAALLRDDAVLTMPPLAAWFRGRAAIRRFLEDQLFGADSRGQFRLLPLKANGCPAFAVYQRGAEGLFRPAVLQVLILDAGQVVRMDDFLVPDERLFKQFRLPVSL